MKVYDNGIVRDLTPEEIAEREAQARLSTISESNRPLSQEEVSRLLISRQINTLTVDDNTSLRMKVFYPKWAAAMHYEVGFKVQHVGHLWRALQAHTSQTGWEPDHAPSLWEQINGTHSGTIDDPIPYEGNMALQKSKYYYQDNAIYLCNRDTGIAVYQPLAQLIDIYVEEV